MAEGQLAQDKVCAGLCHAVADGLDAFAVAGWVVVPWDVCPAIWQALQAFAFSDGQAADRTGLLGDIAFEDVVIPAEGFLIASPPLSRGVRA